MKTFNKGDRVYHRELKMGRIFFEQDHQNADMGYAEFVINGFKEIKQVKSDYLIKYELFYKSIHE